MSNPTLSPCKICSKNTSAKFMVPMKTTTFTLANRKINVMDSYKALVPTCKWQSLSAIDPKICHFCFAKIVRLYIREQKHLAVCTKCFQQPKNLYTKNSIFLVDGRSVALSEVCDQISDESSFCIQCCTGFLRVYTRNRSLEATGQQPTTTSKKRRSIVIRKVEQSAATAAANVDKVIELNICLNCFKPTVGEDIVNMRDIQVTVNEKNVDFLECFKFCTKRVMNSSSMVKPLVCLGCMAKIVDEYEEKHRLEDDIEIKIEPIESLEPSNSASHLPMDVEVKAEDLLTETEIKTELDTESCTETQPHSEPCTDASITEPQRVVEPEMLVAPTPSTSNPTQKQPHSEPCTDVCSIEPQEVANPAVQAAPSTSNPFVGTAQDIESSLNDLDDALAKVDRVDRPAIVDSGEEAEPIKPPKELKTSAASTSKRSQRVSQKKQLTLKHKAVKNKSKVSNTQKLKITNAVNIRCRLCNLLFTKKKLWVHHEMKHSALVPEYSKMLKDNLAVCSVNGTQMKIENIMAAKEIITYYKCTKCDVNFSEFNNYRNHVLSVHKLIMGGKRLLPWKPESFQKGIDALKKGWTYRDVQNFYGISHSTMHRYSKQPKPPGYHRGSVFTLDKEIELAATILEYAKNCFDLLTSELTRSLAFQMAENNEINHRFSVAQQMAGLDWYYKFRERHPEIMDTANVPLFSDRLQEIIVGKKITSTRIYNMDSCSFADVGEKWKRIYSTKDNYSNLVVTLVVAFNAGGRFTTPFQVLKSYRTSKSELEGTVGTNIQITRTGYFDDNMFQKWLENFVQETTPSAKYPVLLIVDQLVCLVSWDYAKANHVILLSLPSTNYCLQPVDLAVFEPLETSFLETAALVDTKTQKTAIPLLSKQLTGAYQQLASKQVAVTGFKDCGLWPIDKAMIDELTAIDNHLCPLCLQKLTSSVLLENHMKSKHGVCYVRPKCPKCPNRWFAHSSHFERHVWLYHRSATYTCEMCGNCMDRQKYRKHSCSYECHYCRCFVKQKWMLVKHFAECRNPKPMRQSDKAKGGNQKYECYCCAKKFGQKGVLSRHLMQQARKQEIRSSRIRERYNAKTVMSSS